LIKLILFMHLTFSRNRSHKVVTGFLFVCLFITGNLYAQQNLTRYVDPFIGAVGEGHIFPGATLPYGMVKLGPDCLPMNANSGYNADGKLKGFSHVHVSGTGGPPKYGNVLVAATSGTLNIQDYATERSGEKASPGYFSVDLPRYGITSEFTVTHSAAFHQYTSTKEGPLNILFDLGSFLSWGGYKEEGELDQELVGSEVRIMSATEIEGYTRVRGGWNVGEAYTVYFYAVTDHPAASWGTWKSGVIRPASGEETDTGSPTGGYFTFTGVQGKPVKMKVGISFISTGKAKQNITNELSHWDFETVRAAAAAE
jgi:putative alpha-1,2-mannosidase